MLTHCIALINVFTTIIHENLMVRFGYFTNVFTMPLVAHDGGQIRTCRLATSAEELKAGEERPVGAAGGRAI
jgi:hypothetical protein